MARLLREYPRDGHVLQHFNSTALELIISPHLSAPFHPEVYLFNSGAFVAYLK